MYYSSYIKIIEVRTILQDTEPVRTAIQKSLKVPAQQISVLHSQAGDQNSRICSHWHQWRHIWGQHYIPAWCALGYNRLTC